MKKSSDKQFKYECKKIASGWVRIHPWIPLEEKERVQNYIRRICRAKEKIQK